MILSVNETKGNQHSKSVGMSLTKLGDLFQKTIYRNDKTAWIRQFWPNAECNDGKSHKCMFYLQQHDMKHSDIKLGNGSPKCRKLSLYSLEDFFFIIFPNFKLQKTASSTLQNIFKTLWESAELCIKDKAKHRYSMPVNFGPSNCIKNMPESVW